MFGNNISDRQIDHIYDIGNWYYQQFSNSIPLAIVAVEYIGELNWLQIFEFGILHDLKVYLKQDMSIYFIILS